MIFAPWVADFSPFCLDTHLQEALRPIWLKYDHSADRFLWFTALICARLAGGFGKRITNRSYTMFRMACQKPVFFD
jgi:hypothetical protein